MVGFNYNGTDYYYRKNLQGDILAIVNARGSVVAKYDYDAWGYNLAVKDASGNDVSNNTTHIANVNPFRYRGYYYDTETKLYYLNSRYYDPEVGRFINADDVQYLGENGDFVNYNLFAYCGNNPVMNKDPEGKFFLAALIISAAAGFIISGTISAVSQYKETGEINVGKVLVNATAGAISGAVAMTPISLGASVALNAALGGLTYCAEQWIDGEKLDVNDLAINVLAGAAGGVIGGRGANAKALSATYKSATQGIIRESRRQNAKYAAKQIVRYMAQKSQVVRSMTVSGVRTIASYFGSNEAENRMMEYFY